ncbi:MAG: thioredoxin domain-containing protein [Candidatus Caldarchaeum sp.]
MLFSWINMSDGMHKPNRLINERSPYLLQHAYNPVDWYPWGEEALRKAKEENKPIFLSIGYSSCHWCHVMEKESFEDEKIAELLNTYFVPVKVDREERPDIDEFYMKAVIMMTGHGGWPLTIFLTPDLKPFFGGTYFPPRRRGGLRGLDEILRGVAELWRKDPKQIMEAAEQNVSLLKSFYTTEKSVSTPSYNLVVTAFDILATSFDSLYGGFGGAPKFPMPVYLDFLQVYSVLEKESAAVRMVSTTLENMARGGLRDHLGGGFFRYSTDRVWLVPHFEKMLYDNALLARVYMQHHLITGDSFYREVGESTLDWLMNEMMAPSGGFFSAVDADSAEGEGAYYVWRLSELEQILGPELAKIAAKTYAVTDTGNFEHGKNILTMRKRTADLAAELGLDEPTLKQMLEEIRSKLLDARRERPAPAVDDKIIAAWNGLAVSALCTGYRATGEKRYLDAAVKTMDFIISNMWLDNTLHRIYKNGAFINGFLDDYAAVVNALLDVFEVSFEPRYLAVAVDIADKMVELFWDNVDGGFYYTVEDVAEVTRIKDAYDGATPSGNTLAAAALLKLSELTGETKYLQYVEGTFKCFASRLEATPAEHTGLITVLAGFHKSRMEVVLVTESLQDAQPYLAHLYREFKPFRSVVVVHNGNREMLQKYSSLVADKPAKGPVTAYVCENYSCRMPVTSLEEFVKLLS